MLFVSLTGRSDTITVAPQTFMLNDSVVCTSLTNVIRTANEIKMLKAQRDFLKEGLAVSRVENDDYKKTLNQVRMQILWAEIKKPLIVVGTFGLGILTGKKLR